MAHHRTFKRFSALALVLIAGAAHLGFLAPSAARGDVSDANALYRDVAPNRRSDEVLLPLLAAMDPLPKVVGTHEQAMLLLSGMQGFDEAKAWAEKEPQKAILAGLKRVTQEQDFTKAYAFAQPYGADSVDPKLVRAGLYTELGDPALLPGARFLYLPALDGLFCLANVEASRLLGEKKPAEALNVLTDMLYFARQMCDRQFKQEAGWGLTAYIELNGRIRDVLYLDTKAGTPTLTAEDLKSLLKRMDMTKPTTAYLDLDRMKFPAGDLLGFEQVADSLFTGEGTPNDAQFASTLARLRSSNRPLRLFSEAGKWGASSAGHASKAETLRSGRSAYNDWRTRWELPWHDALRGTVQEYRSLDAGRFAAVKATVPDMNEVMMLRQEARTELLGTRNAAAAVGASIQRGGLQTLLVSLRPEWLLRLGVDPFNPQAQDLGAAPPLQYFVPPASGKDVTVVLESGQSFRVLLKNDVFVLYSLGSDGSDEKASRVQNTGERLQVSADYLLYPPILSLQRQSLIDLGQLN